MKSDVQDDMGGQTFSLDALLAIVIITVIIGISADAMDVVSYRIQDYSSEYSFERITSDTADILIKTPGSPENWEYSYCDSPGLAEVDAETCGTVSNTLSTTKISKLSERYEDLMGKVLPEGADSNMFVYPMDPSLPPIVIHNKTHPDASEIAITNRTVLCDYTGIMSLVTINACKNSSVNLQAGHGWEICPDEHEKPDFDVGKPGWICHHFTVKEEDLNFTDFYVTSTPILGDGSAGWIIDTSDNMSCDKQCFSSGPYNVNNRISQLLGNDRKKVLWFHVNTDGNPEGSFNAYILAVPKGTSPYNVSINYMNPQPAFFVLEVWI